MPLFARLKRFIKQIIINSSIELRFIGTSPSYSSKVFCIGFLKTGTTSIGHAFTYLGFRNATYNQKVWREYYKKGKIDKILRYTARFDSFDDLPWLKEDMIPILDKKFPGSKFIYLERDEEAWKKSYYNWSYKIYGKYSDPTEGFEQYKNHREFVLNYFKGRDQDFIKLEVKDKDAFNKIAHFLSKPLPNKKLPHINKT